MNANKSQSLERILESAVVASWTNLMRGTQAGLIHIEYGFTANGTLDNLKLWSSVTRGHWLLVGEYWTAASQSHCAGFHFEDGYRSEALAQILESVMQHQTEFSFPVDCGRQGLLQIATPTEQESVPTSALVNETLRHLGSLAELAPA